MALDPISCIEKGIDVTKWAIQYYDDYVNSPGQRLFVVNETNDKLALVENLRILQNGERANAPTTFLSVVARPLDEYVECLERIKTEALGSEGKNRLQRFCNRATWRGKKKSIEIILQKAAALQSTLQLATSMSNLKVIGETKEEVCDMSMSLQESDKTIIANTERTNLSLAHIQSNVGTIANSIAGREMEELADWILSDGLDDHHKQLNNTLDRREDGTGEWFFHLPQFESWRDKEPTTLFFKGDPGAGKSVLAASVVQHLQNARRCNVAVVFLFSSSEFGVTKMSLRSEKELRQRLLLREVISAIGDVVPRFGDLFIVIDGVDECEPLLRSKLMIYLRSLGETCSIRLLVTARPIPDIEQDLRPNATYRLTAQEDDIKLYLDSQMESLRPCIRDSPALQLEIRQTITSVVDGVFLLARLFIESLRDKRSMVAVENALQEFKNGANLCDEAYDTAMTRIQNQRKDDARLAMRVLLWVTRAKRALFDIELQHAAVHVQGNGPPRTDELVSIDDILSVCAGLLVYDSRTEIIKPCHLTTQTYLEKRFLELCPTGDADVAMDCISYLSGIDVPGIIPFLPDESSDSYAVLVFKNSYREFGNELFNKNDSSYRKFGHWPSKFFSWTDMTRLSHMDDKQLNGVQQVIDELVHKAPLVYYALKHWGHHVADSEVRQTLSSTLQVEARKLLTNTEFWVFCHALIYDSSYTILPDIFNRVVFPSSPMHFAVYFDIVSATKEMLSVGWRVGEGNESPLALAARIGNERVTQALLESIEYDQGMRGKGGVAALSYAAEKGNTNIMRMLIDKGVDVNAMALKREPLSYVPFIRETNTPTPHRIPALVYAADNGHVAAGRLLLETGKVNINSATSHRASLNPSRRSGIPTIFSRCHALNGITALHAAAKGGHIEFVKLLIHWSAPVEKYLEASRKLSPLERKLQKPARKKICMHKLNLTRQNGGRETALSFAVLAEQEETARLLMQTPDLDINDRDEYGNTILLCAIHHRLYRPIRFLLSLPEVDLDLRKRQDTPFYHACKIGHLRLVEIFLDSGRIIPSRCVDDQGFSPLFWAHDKDVRDLLARYERENIHKDSHFMWNRWGMNDDVVYQDSDEQRPRPEAMISLKASS